jgi:hypothetical protein
MILFSQLSFSAIMTLKRSNKDSKINLDIKWMIFIFMHTILDYKSMFVKYKKNSELIQFSCFHTILMIWRIHLISLNNAQNAKKSGSKYQDVTEVLIAEIEQNIMMNLNLKHILDMFLEKFKILFHLLNQKKSLVKMGKKKFLK